MKEKAFKTIHKAYKFSNSWPGTIIIVLLIIFFVAQAFRIPSGSMKDSLLVGDHLFAKKFAYGIATPRIPFLEIPLIPGTDGHIIDGDKPARGDIVIFRYPNNTKLHYVKRCVALEGDKIMVINKDLYIHPHEGNDYIKENFNKKDLLDLNNELWVKNPYLREHPGIHHDAHITNNGRMPIQIFSFGPTRVPEGEYFMMGDNRDHSNDSRFWGTVPYGLIEGTPWFIYFSMGDDYEVRWDRIGKVPSDLEEGKLLERAVKIRKIQDGKDYGLY